MPEQQLRKSEEIVADEPFDAMQRLTKDLEAICPHRAERRELVQC